MSAVIYTVRCNFRPAEREADWHAWYSGPKLKQMLALPHFLSCQRFGAAALDVRRRWLALWRVARPEALTTPEYRAQWGFADWTAHVGDWNRDLFRLLPGEAVPALAIAEDGALYAASFDGLDTAAVAGTRERAAALVPGLAWYAPAGLDRSTGLFGLAAVARDWRPPAGLTALGARETLYHPLIPRIEGG